MTNLTIRNLTIEYTQGAQPVRPVEGLDIDAADGELVVLLGPSGSGKTTLLACLAGILTPAAGEIRVGDVDVTKLRGAALARYRRETVGVIFQAFNLIPSLTARENVMAPMRLARMRAGKARRRAADLLAMVGLEHRMHHRPRALSGGQQQRVAIARALAHEPPLSITCRSRRRRACCAGSPLPGGW
jgi:putative ABC transport system ATP-binding protein